METSVKHDQWIIDCIIQFSKSPLFFVPLENFIDLNCLYFPQSNEISHESFIIYRKFQKLLDDLFTEFLEELGVPLNHAYDVIKYYYQSSKKHREIVDQLITFLMSYDDVKLFIKLMEKRNTELDLEVLRGVSIVNEENLSSEDNSLLEAIRNSQMIEDERKKQLEEEEAELQRAIEESLAEFERYKLSSMSSLPQDSKDTMISNDSQQLSPALANQSFVPLSSKANMQGGQNSDIGLKISEMATLASKSQTENDIIPHDALRSMKISNDNNVSLTENDKDLIKSQKHDFEINPPLLVKAKEEISGFSKTYGGDCVPSNPSLSTQKSDLDALSAAMTCTKSSISYPFTGVQKPISGSSVTKPILQPREPEHEVSKILTKEDFEKRAKSLRQERELLIRQKISERDAELKKYCQEKSLEVSLNKSERDLLTIQLAQKLRDDLMGVSQTY